ncbi:DUF4372 domain-containing protein [Desulfurivibrio sp. C05AmB]|uniref:DUF4372 domain-containing protein n=1 Tax=Desulfurivibrio sp. C05AmB TaxID=3374371 RepID=UPI00376EB2F8
MRALFHHSTISWHIAAFLPRHEFDSLVNKHHRGQKFRTFSRWASSLWPGSPSGNS